MRRFLKEIGDFAEEQFLTLVCDSPERRYIRRRNREKFAYSGLFIRDRNSDLDRKGLDRYRFEICILGLDRLEIF